MSSSKTLHHLHLVQVEHGSILWLGGPAIRNDLWEHCFVPFYQLGASRWMARQNKTDRLTKVALVCAVLDLDPQDFLLSKRLTTVCADNRVLAAATSVATIIDTIIICAGRVRFLRVSWITSTASTTTFTATKHNSD